MNHFFVTVGTSQLTNEHLGFADDISRRIDRIVKTKTRVEKESAQIADLAPLLLRRLAEYWNDLDGLQPALDDNCFGAEITTLLYVLLKQSTLPSKTSFKEKITASTPQDRFYLHISDTSSGRLAGCVLSDFLRDVWNVSPHEIHLYHADQLDQNPNNTAQAILALQNFAKCLADSLGHSASDQGSQPTRHFIMSGGFKSVIPTLDRFALAYDIPLSYVFEDAPAPIYGEKLHLADQTRKDIRKVLECEYLAAQLPPLEQF